MRQTEVALAGDGVSVRSPTTAFTDNRDKMGQVFLLHSTPQSHGFMPFDPNPVIIPATKGLAPRDVKRLTVAAVVSVCLHLTLVLGVTMQPSPMRRPPAVVLEARLVGAPLTAAPPGATASEDHIIMTDHAAEAVDAATRIPPGRQAPTLSPAPVIDNLGQPTGRHATTLNTVDVAVLAVPSPVDATYYSMSQLDVRPKALVPIVPEFPPGAAATHVQGRVVLLVLIDETGNVDDVAVAEAAPAGYFEESALAALRAVRFEPGRRFNQPVRSRVLLSVNYDAIDDTRMGE